MKDEPMRNPSLIITVCLSLAACSSNGVATRDASTDQICLITDAVIDSPAGDGKDSSLDADMGCPDLVPWLSASATCPIDLAWTPLRCIYSAVPPGTTGSPCTVSFQCQCLSGQGRSPTCAWSEVTIVCPDAGVPVDVAHAPASVSERHALGGIRIAWSLVRQAPG